MSVKAKTLHRALLAVAAAALLLIFSEVYLKLEGYSPHDSSALWRFDSYNPVMGWETVSGVKRHREVSGKEVCETVWRDGSRASRPDYDKPASKRVMLIGCSYTYGWQVSDEETWAWLLNERFPDIAFDNYGVYAYGLCQSLARAEQILERGQKYDWIVYAAMHDHPFRDVSVFHILGKISGCGPYVLSRRASVNRSGDLVYLPCEPRWPGDDLLISVNFAKRVYSARLQRQAHQRGSIDRQLLHSVYFKLLDSLRDLAQRHGCRLAVCGLDEEDWGNALELGQRHLDFPFFFVGNGREGAADAPIFHVSGQMSGHPSALVHANWAKRIGDWVEANISE
ncbi:hypothetical protein IJT17_05385 [bacterium]|nr:hypothetical protein [bacterium]